MSPGSSVSSPNETENDANCRRMARYENTDILVSGMGYVVTLWGRIVSIDRREADQWDR